jgi:hypothetical protein
VGIAKYIEPASQPRLWKPTALRPIPVQGIFRPHVLPQLEGPVADVYAMRDLLVNTYGFQKPSSSLSARENDDIQILINENATADRILTLLKAHLIDKAKPGDISVFYFAGHGSRIRNELSEKPGRLDVTMVPADYALGVPAIRDKELARIYRQVPDGVSLTVIQDNCYSGGGARGASPSLRSRDLPDDPRTVSDPPDERSGKRLPYPDQQKNPVLILAASQPDQTALEMDMGAEAGYRGVFTYALEKTLKNAVTHERVDEIFRKLRANMGLDRQEPVVSGQGRLDKDIFGQEAIPASSVYAIVRSRAGAKIQLEGGIANGIRAGCVLKKDQAGPGQAAVRIRVTGTKDLNSSIAEVTGDTSQDEIERGDKFLIEAFAPSPGPPFRVYMPAKSFPESELLPMVSKVRERLVRAGATWVDDPAQQPPPTHTLVWNGTSWQLYSADSPSAPKNLGATLAAENVAAKVADPKHARFFLQAPPSNELLARMAIGKGETAAIEVTSGSQTEATYALTGVVRANDVAYFWLRTEKTGEQFPPLSTPIAAADPRIGDQLTEDIRTLDRVAGWLTLSAAGDIDPPFPYRLALKKVGGDGRIAEKQVVEDETYKLYLKGDRQQLDALLRASDPKLGPPKRYIYVGITDSEGRGQLLFPEPGAGNQGNRFPVVEENNGNRSLPEEIPLTHEAADIQVTPPFGVDHYYLLVSATPLSNPEVLSFAGAYRPEQRRGVEDADPLTRLLRSVGDSRGATPVANPTTWSIDHMLIRSVAK